MMSPVATRADTALSSPICKTCLMAFAIAAGLMQAETATAQTGWNARVETEAERAYRSVHERFLATIKARPAEAKAKPHAKAAEASDPVVPELPERDERRVQKAAAAAEPSDQSPEAPPATAEPPQQEVAAATAESLDPFADPSPASIEPPQEQEMAWRSPMDLMGNPVIPEPNLSEVITTQVIGDDQEPPAESRRPTPGPAEQYCSNIANAASDARFAWQKQLLAKTEEQVKQRVDELNGKIAEYQKWLARRDEFSQKAQVAVTDIYAKMKPDAAAQQLMALDDEMAAAVITKLNPRIASALMAEMDPKQAARLTSIISDSARGPKGKPPAKPAGGT
jgi:flagellar motility protein MotE (MotC chaperone)